ncbi:MAG: leucine-rich repeat domain-containing protein [Anaerolineae bacterium]
MSHISFAVVFQNDRIQAPVPAAAQKLSYFGSDLSAVIVLCDEKGQRPDLAKCISQKTYENIFEIVQATLTEHADTLFLSPQRGYIPRQLTETFLSFDRLRVPNKFSMELSSLATKQTAEKLLRSCTHAIRKEVASHHNATAEESIFQIPKDILARAFYFLDKIENATILCKKFNEISQGIYKQKLIEKLNKNTKELDAYIKEKFPEGVSYQRVYAALLNDPKNFLKLMEEAYRARVGNEFDEKLVKKHLGDAYERGDKIAEKLTFLDALKKADDWKLALQDGSFNMKAFASKVETIELLKANLRSLDPFIGHFTDLTGIDLSHNGLNELPVELAKCENLTTLVLKGNKFVKIPTFVYSFTKLQRLYVKNNNISKISAKIAQITPLKIFDITKNPLKKIPAQLIQLKNLESFRFDPNKLERIEAIFFDCRALKTFYFLQMSSHIQGNFNDLVKTFYEKIPETVSRKAAADFLQKTFEQASRSPRSILQEGLYTVHLIKYDLIDVAHDWLLEKTMQNLLGNQIYQEVKKACYTNLGWEIYLRVINPKLSLLKILGAIGQLRLGAVGELREVKFDDPVLQSPFANRVFSDFEYLFNNYADFLNAFEKAKQFFNKNANALGKIEQLNLSSMGLMDLPKEMTSLTGLKNIDLKGNFFADAFPTHLLELKCLETIDLQSCHIRRIPEGIQDLPRLNELNLNDNPLVFLPQSLKKMDSLKLHINSNEMLEVPAELLTRPDILHSYLMSVQALMLKDPKWHGKWIPLLKALPDAVKKEIDPSKVLDKDTIPQAFFYAETVTSFAHGYINRIDAYFKKHPKR